MEQIQQKHTMGEILLEVGKSFLIGCIIFAMLMGAFWLGGFVNSLN